MPDGSVFRIGHDIKPDSDGVMALINAHLPLAENELGS